MSIKNQDEYTGTQRKLALLEAQYQQALKRPATNRQVHELSLRSLRRMINQLKEELVVYKAHAAIGNEP